MTRSLIEKLFGTTTTVVVAEDLAPKEEYAFPIMITPKLLGSVPAARVLDTEVLALLNAKVSGTELDVDLAPFRRLVASVFPDILEFQALQTYPASLQINRGAPPSAQ